MMNLKRRGTRWALYRSRWIPRSEGVPHGYSIQEYVGSISADSEQVPEMLKSGLTASESLMVERRVCAAARAARAAGEAEAARLSKDPNWRLAKAAELVSEAAALSQARCVPASHVRAIQLSLAGVQVLGAERVSSSAGRVDVMRGALASITSAAKAIRDGALGNAPSTGARTTGTYSLWSQIVDAVEGPSEESLLSALQLGAVIQAATNVAGFDRLDGCVRRDQMVCHAGTPKPQCDRFCGSCRSSCNVNSETGGWRETSWDKKKALER